MKNKLGSAKTMARTRTIPLPKVKLLESDGEPLESPWHVEAIHILIDVIRNHYHPRTDFFVGGNNFIYFSEKQARNLDYRGPDFYFVDQVDGLKERKYWAVWEEEGRYPNVIVELLSDTTAKEDRTTKKRIYEQTFRTPEYYCYDPNTHTIEGWRLTNGHYSAIEADANGRLWCEQFGLWFGPWEGLYERRKTIWPRFFHKDGSLALTHHETALRDTAKANKQAVKALHRAEGAEHRAETAEQRAETAEQALEKERLLREKLEAELARLRAGGTPKNGNGKGSKNG